MKKITSSILIFMIYTTPLYLYANDNILLNFHGNIKAAACNISGGDNIDINLNDISMGTFYAPGSGSDWKSFNIELKECSSYVNQVKLTFTGTVDNAEINSLYKNQGTAANIALQLQNQDGSIPLGNNKVLTVPTNGQTIVSIPLRTRAFSVTGNGTAGTLSTNITATITYL